MENKFEKMKNKFNKDCGFIINDEAKLFKIKTELKKLNIVSKSIKEIELLIDAKKQEKVPVIIGGEVNSGKSSLSNCILGRKDYFKVGDVRETKKNKNVEMDEYILIDTPGLNCNKVDDREAISAYKKYGVIVFVHSILDGELQENEVKELKNIIKINGENNLIIALTSAKQKDENEGNNIKLRIKDQLDDIVKIEERYIVLVDSKSFMKGLTENKNTLINSSNINILKEEILNKVEFIKITKSKYLNEQLKVKSKLFIDEIKESEEIQNLNKRYNELLIRYNEFENINHSIDKLIEKVDKVEKSENKVVDENVNGGRVRLTTSYTEEASDYNYSSESSAERAGKQQFNKIYDRGPKKFCSKGSEVLRQHRKNAIEGSINFKNYLIAFVNDINKELLGNDEFIKSINEILKKILVEIKEENLNINKESNSDINEKIFKTGDYLLAYNEIFYEAYHDYVESSSWYSKYIDTDSYMRYKSGFFRDKYVEVYKYSISSEINELERDLGAAIDRGWNRAAREVNNGYLKFVSRLLNIIKRNIKDIEKVMTKAKECLEKEIKAEENKIELIVKIMN